MGRARSSRGRAFVGSSIVSTGLLLLTVGPAGAATCTLTAPASVAIGDALTVEGSGFPASTAIDVTITVADASPDTFTTQSDAAGTFAVVLTTEPSDKGQTTVAATAGPGCSDQVVISVGEPADVTPQPSRDGAVAASSGAPPTDAVSMLTGAVSQGNAAWLGLVLLSLGIGGLILTKPARSR